MDVRQIPSRIIAPGRLWAKRDNGPRLQPRLVRNWLEPELEGGLQDAGQREGTRLFLKSRCRIHLVTTLRRVK
jgi:hypothetical protein